MLVVSNLSKRFPGETAYLFENVSFLVNRGERVGLIGPNGSGKSTLIRIIIGAESATRGSVQWTPANTRVGYLPQSLHVDNAQTVDQVVFPQKAAIQQAERDLETLAERIAEGDEQAYARYDEALERLVRWSEAMDENAGHQALADLGLGAVSLETGVNTLSGGQKTRLILAALMASRPEMLILDEPTNHLDIAALKWLEAWLHEFEGGVLIVSHDRKFLDNVLTKLVALDTETTAAEVFVGTYSDYAAHKRFEQDKQYHTWKDQQAEIARLRADASRTMARAVNRENATKNDFQRGRAKMVAKKAKAKETRIEKYLESDDFVEKPALRWDVKLDFQDVKPIGGDAVRLESLTIGYDFPLIEDINLSIRGQERVAIIGPNGHGKSTLLKTIIGELPPLSGQVYISAGAQVGYLSQEQDVLLPQWNSVQAIQDVQPMTETEARAFLHFFLFSGDDPLRRVRDLSYGERTRLMLARLVAGGANVLVMDEPLNHLDVTSREKFEQAILNFSGTVLVIAHDRAFVEQFAQKVWLVENGMIREEIQELV